MDTPADPDCYWVEPGRLLAGFYPDSDATETAREKLRGLLDCGIRAFVDLTEPHEPLEDYEALLHEEAAALGLTVTYARLPIPDMAVPAPDGMRAILYALARALDGGTPVYVHCWGGIGRTGTVVGCWLAERRPAGPGPDALEELTALRSACRKRRLSSPETSRQADFVRAWPVPSHSGNPA